LLNKAKPFNRIEYICIQQGKGCFNTNQSNPSVTAEGYKDVLEFFKGLK